MKTFILTLLSVFTLSFCNAQDSTLTEQDSLIYAHATMCIQLKNGNKIYQQIGDVDSVFYVKDWALGSVHYDGGIVFYDKGNYSDYYQVECG